MSKFFGNNLDFWGFLASFACALHCAAVPIILLFGTLGSFSWLADHRVELIFIAISIILAYWSLWNSYQKHHQNYRAIRIAGFGFGFLVVSRLVPHAIGDILVVIGGLLIAYAHYVNWKLLRQCKHCGHKKNLNKIKTPQIKKNKTRLRRMVS
jgi:membrane protease YdiL (CAAX protease family)